MKIGVHQTDKYIWEKFRFSHDPLCTVYCADGDGFVEVKQVEQDCFMVMRGDFIESFHATRVEADGEAKAIDQAVRDAPPYTVVEALKGKCYLCSEGDRIATFDDLAVALSHAESYANASYPGMLDRVAAPQRNIG